MPCSYFITSSFHHLIFIDIYFTAQVGRYIMFYHQNSRHPTGFVPLDKKVKLRKFKLCFGKILSHKLETGVRYVFLCELIKLVLKSGWRALETFSYRIAMV